MWVLSRVVSVKKERYSLHKSARLYTCVCEKVGRSAQCQSIYNASKTKNNNKTNKTGKENRKQKVKSRGEMYRSGLHRACTSNTEKFFFLK